MNFSITQMFAIYLIIGALTYFLMSLPSILPILNVILATLYLLYTYNLIQFQAEPKLLVAGTLLILAALFFFQIITSKKKMPLIAATLGLISSLSAALIYTGVINRVKNLDSVKAVIQQLGK